MFSFPLPGHKVKRELQLVLDLDDAPDAWTAKRLSLASIT